MAPSNATATSVFRQPYLGCSRACFFAVYPQSRAPQRPLLKKVDARHHLKFFRQAARTFRLGVKRFYDLAQLKPRHHRVHLSQKLFPAHHLAVELKGFVGKGLLAYAGTLLAI